MRPSVLLFFAIALLCLTASCTINVHLGPTWPPRVRLEEETPTSTPTPLPTPTAAAPVMSAAQLTQTLHAIHIFNQSAAITDTAPVNITYLVNNIPNSEREQKFRLDSFTAIRLVPTDVLNDSIVRLALTRPVTSTDSPSPLPIQADATVRWRLYIDDGSNPAEIICDEESGWVWEETRFEAVPIAAITTTAPYTMATVQWPLVEICPLPMFTQASTLAEVITTTHWVDLVLVDQPNGTVDELYRFTRFPSGINPSGEDTQTAFCERLECSSTLGQVVCYVVGCR